MTQFNLLPNVKLEYVKTQHTKHLLTVASVLVSIVSLVIFALSIVTVDVVQKKSLDDLNHSIAVYNTKLTSIKGLDKMLTVQNQLRTLTSLHDKKPVASRLFAYIAQLTPAQASLNQLSVDFTANTLTVGGSAPTLDAVSTYTDTLKATTYKLNGTETGTHAFSNVVLSAFGRTTSGATFTITCTFDPAIFNTNDSIALTVPQSANANQSSVFNRGGN